MERKYPFVFSVDSIETRGTALTFCFDAFVACAHSLQAGRYDLALKVIDKTGNTWRALQGEGRSLPVATDRDGKGVHDGSGDGGRTYIANGGVGIGGEVDDRRETNMSEREAAHGHVERLGNVVVGVGSRWGLDGADEVRAFSLASRIPPRFLGPGPRYSPLSSCGPGEKPRVEASRRGSSPRSQRKAGHEWNTVSEYEGTVQFLFDTVRKAQIHPPRWRAYTASQQAHGTLCSTLAQHREHLSTAV